MIRATDLLGCIVRTDSGEKLGRVHDLRLRAHPREGWQLVGLVVGTRGVLERLGAASGIPTVRGMLVPWGAIVKLEEGSITVRSGTVVG